MKYKSPPSYISEIVFVMANLLILKFYNERFFDAMSIFNICTPILLYLVCCLLINLMDFIKQMHIEEMTGSSCEDESGLDSIISPV
jgi:hypothetical protein